MLVHEHKTKPRSENAVLFVPGRLVALMATTALIADPAGELKLHASVVSLK